MSQELGIVTVTYFEKIILVNCIPHYFFTNSLSNILPSMPTTSKSSSFLLKLVFFCGTITKCFIKYTSLNTLLFHQHMHLQITQYQC